MKNYDVIIIGAGPGGLTTALYASRAGLSVLMLDGGIYGGQMNNTEDIENYPGFTSITGPALSERMYNSSINFGAEYKYGVVKAVEDKDNTKLITTDDKEVYQAPVVVIGTGAQYKTLNVPGEAEYSGRGVSYCAVCDGAFFKNKEVVVVGGGDSALEEALYLANITAKVTIIHRRDNLRAQKILQDRAFANKKINFIWNTNVEEIVGNKEHVTGVKIVNNKTKVTNLLPTSGVFIYVGIRPMTKEFKNLGITDKTGWIVTNDQMQTIRPGILAVGDVRAKQLRQITTAVGDGGIAGQRAFNYLQSQKSRENVF